MDVLEYRSPGTGAPRVQRVLNALTSAEHLGAAAIALKLVIAVPLCFLGPWLVAWALTALDRRLALNLLPGVAIVFVLASLIIVPWLMWQERRTRGTFYENAVRGETSPFGARSYGEYQLQRITFSSIFYMEMALFGPRLVWEVIDSTSGRSPVDSPTRAAAAQVILDLLDAGEGLPIRQLLRPAVSVGQLRRAIRYLKERDWIDVSARGDRAWLTSIAQERLTPTILR